MKLKASAYDLSDVALSIESFQDHYIFAYRHLYARYLLLNYPKLKIDDLNSIIDFQSMNQDDQELINFMIGILEGEHEKFDLNDYEEVCNIAYATEELDESGEFKYET